MLDEDHLQLDIKPQQDAQVYDESDGSLICMVVHDVCKNHSAIEFIDGVIKALVEMRKTS